MTGASIMSVEARLARARGILADREGQSDARLRRACLTILNIAPHDDPQRAEAERLRKELTPTN
jgi:hypothetical protein